MACREICKKYRFVRTEWGGTYYDNGASRCQGKCLKYILWNGLYCPCCGIRLRKKARQHHNKQDESAIKIAD